MTLSIDQLRKRGLPQIEGVLRIKGLDGPVTIVRDKWGCPHIDARTENDVWFAQGFCHAQDRLWQMERTRRFARGTLAEILGEPLIPIDRQYRRLGIRRVSERDFPLLNKEARRILQTFADGVNAAIISMRELPPEFAVLDLVPERWSPADSIAQWKVIFLTQTVSEIAHDYSGKILRAAILRQFGPKVLTLVEPHYPEDAPVVCPPGSTASGLGKGLDSFVELAAKLAPLSGPDAGSNNWAIDGSLSASGKPMLAGDPHAVIQVASVWYQNHLKTPDWEMIGVSTPGVPGIMLYGHNGRVGWTVTNAMADIADFFVERFDKSYHRYLYCGEWRKAEVWHEEIQVKGKPEPVVEDIPVTVHGPVVTGGPFGPGPALAWQWTAHEVVRTFECITGMAKARNVDEFDESQRYWSGPPMNRITADDSGNIAYRLVGNVPIRAHGGANAVPAPGWTGEYDWLGYIPFDELPHAKNPDRHFIVSANNRCTPPGYKYHVNLFNIPYRAKRIEELLKKKSRFDARDFMAIQGDFFSCPAAAIVRMLAKIPAAPETGEALGILREWDGVLSPSSATAAIYQVFAQKLLGRLFTFARILPGAPASLDSWQSSFLRKVPDCVEREDRMILDLNEGTRGKSWPQVITESLKEAWDFLKQAHGPEPKQWTWGKLHHQTFIHNLGRSAPYDELFNIPPVGLGGDGSTPFNTGGPIRAGFDSLVGVSYRMIVDLADVSHAYWILPPGQSGHPGSPHYSDGIQPWLNMQYHPMLWDWAHIRAHQEGTLELQPG
jgi:penicillin amidase